MPRRISKRHCKVATGRANALIKEVRQGVKGHYKFIYKLVGSGNWGTMVEDKDGHYDLDYQIILTHNSGVYKRDGCFKSPTIIKSDFLKAFKKFKSEGEEFQDSTTAITLINKDKRQPYSIDFVIIDGTPFSKGQPVPRQIIKRNIKAETNNADEKTWNKLRDVHHAYEYFNKLPPEDKQIIIEKMVVPRKIKEKSKPADKQTVSSYEIFVQEILHHEKRNS